MGLSFLRLQQQDRLSKHLYLRQSNCGAFGDPSLWVRWLGCPDRATFHCGTCMGLPLHRLGRRQAIHYCWSWDSAGAPWRESLPRWVWSSLPSCACGHRGRCDSDTWLRSGVWKFETHWMSTWVHYAALLILLMYRACFSTLIPDPSWLLTTGRLLIIVITHSETVWHSLFFVPIGTQPVGKSFGVLWHLPHHRKALCGAYNCDRGQILHACLDASEADQMPSFKFFTRHFYQLLALKGQREHAATPWNSKGFETGLMLCTEIIWNNVEYFEHWNSRDGLWKWEATVVYHIRVSYSWFARHTASVWAGLHDETAEMV